MNRLSTFRIPALLALALLASACAGNHARTSMPASNVVQDEAATTTDAAMPATAAEPVTTDAQGAIADPSLATAAPQDAAIAPAAPTAQGGQPTQAEQDFNAIYGGQDVYNPVADPTLPTPVQMPTIYDPWEKWNRHVHAFNDVVDRAVAKPLAKAYMHVVPRPVRLGVGNFFNNLGQPVTALNALLQGKPKEAGQAAGRFLVNTTVGVLGIFDPASHAKIPFNSEDFGQTLGVWGWKRSRYVELPLFGPRTVRDTFGLVGDGQLSPIRQVEDDKTRIFLQGLQLVDVRTQLFAVDSMRAGAVDDYALVRDAWSQRRNYQIFGEKKSDEQALPDYLQDDSDNPTVPADAMPLIPGSATP